jgi:hypothetical protein
MLKPVIARELQPYLDEHNLEDVVTSFKIESACDSIFGFPDSYKITLVLTCKPKEENNV